MTRCGECHGAGVREITTEAGADVEAMCRECCGLGFMEAADMLATIIAIRDADRMARALGEPGLTLAPALRERIARTIAVTASYSVERMAEIRAKEVAR